MLRSYEHGKQETRPLDDRKQDIALWPQQGRITTSTPDSRYENNAWRKPLS